MKFRIVDVVLLLATLVGAFMAAHSARKLHGLQREHARLNGVTGDLIIADPTQLHVRAIHTGDPLHLAWRVYAPAGQMTFTASSGSGGSSNSTGHNSAPREFIAQIRFTEHNSGQMTIYHSFGGGSGQRSIPVVGLFQFLRDHSNELVIEQLGAPEPARVKPGESATLLRVSLPDKLLDEARKQLTDSSSSPLPPVVIESRVGMEP